MIEPEILKVLLVEDDEDDYIITRDLFSGMSGQRFILTWVQTFEKGLEAMLQNRHHMYLVDYRLGAHNGIELLRAALEGGCQSPVILLTGAGEHQIDLEAMEAGAADYLVKTELQSNTLERSLRYALQRQKATAAAVFEQARLAAFGAEVGLALTRRDSLKAIMDRCSEAMVKYLSAALARIETFDPETGLFEPLSEAGTFLESNIPSGIPSGVRLEGGPLTEGKPVIVRQLQDHVEHAWQEWSKSQGLVSYAAYPLLLEDKLVGVMSLFTKQPVTEQIWLEMASVAHGVSLCIERKRSDEALGLSEFKYRTVVESIKEVIFQLDELGNWTVLNPAWTAITGFEVKPSLGTLFLDYVHRDDRQQNQEMLLSFTGRKMDQCRYETRFLTSDGNYRWVEVFWQASLNNENNMTGISGTLTDITDRKIAETQIQKLAAFPRVNPNPVLEFALDGTLSYANEAAITMANSLGKDLIAFLPADASAIARDCLSSKQNKLRQNVSINGRTITWSFFPIVSSQVVHCYGADVTDMLNLEAQLRHAQKLESVGQLAAGIAHDFNNILTVIHGYSDSLITRFRDDERTREALCQIKNASKRAAALTRQLLTFSRKHVIQTKALNLNGVLQNLADMLPRLLGEDIVLETRFLPGLPCIEADTGMLEQIVMNLAVNARDAMPNGGKLLMETAAVQIEHDCEVGHPESRAGLFSCLTITDSGCGMDLQTKQRLFEPFFTTKAVGKGTGLGLATVYGIVKQHQGWIEVKSEPCFGATFKIYFPAIPEAVVTNPSAPLATDKVQGGKETILLVEDEPVVRELVREILETYDYSIIEAGSGVEALRVWEQNEGKVDLLLTDIIMPEGLNGRDLANQLKIRKPDLKVIFSSGYSAETLGRNFRDEETAFLPKPYLPAQLAQLVRQRLDTARPKKGLEPVPDDVREASF